MEMNQMQTIMAERTTHKGVRTAAAFSKSDPDRRIEQHYGGVGGRICLTLWDTGCSHNLVTPEFAAELVRAGAVRRKCAPLPMQHGAGENEDAPDEPKVCKAVFCKSQQSRSRSRTPLWYRVHMFGLSSTRP